jgi:hypothetical protein
MAQAEPVVRIEEKAKRTRDSHVQPITIGVNFVDAKHFVASGTLGRLDVLLP